MFDDLSLIYQMQTSHPESNIDIFYCIVAWLGSQPHIIVLQQHCHSYDSYLRRRLITTLGHIELLSRKCRARCPTCHDTVNSHGSAAALSQMTFQNTATNRIFIIELNRYCQALYYTFNEDNLHFWVMHIENLKMHEQLE